MVEPDGERSAKSPAAMRTISEVSEDLGVPQHILRFWETRFPELRPLKRGGNRRYYRPEDVALCRALKRLLHEEGYTVKGVRKLIAAGGTRALVVPAPSPPELPGLAEDVRLRLVAIRDRLARALASAAHGA
jgi:DNA-binding transcriptional MerR regulator